MKKYLPYIFLITLLVVMSSSKVITLFSKDVFATFYYSLLPSLAPSILLDYLFINSSGLETIYNLLTKKTKHPHVIYRHLLVLLGLISGTPTLASYVNDSMNKNLLSKKEGEIILSCFTIPSFPFIFGVILPKLNQIRKLILLTLLYVPPTIYYFFKLKNENGNSNKLVTFASKKINIIQKSIYDTSKTLLLLIGSILLFSIPLPFFKVIFHDSVAYYLIGLFEFTTSSLYIINNTSSLSFAILILILTFSSLSVYSQISVLCSNISIKKILKKRFLFLEINIILLFIFFIFKIL